MRASVVPHGLIVAVLTLGLAGAAAEPPPSAERLRQELRAFFASGAETAPTVLRGLAANPDSRAGILEGVERLSAAELEELAQGFQAVPGWEAVPEALVASLPPGSRDALRRHADGAAKAAEELERFREEIATLYAAARLLPAPVQARLGLDREALGQAQTGLGQLDLGRLQQARGVVDASGGWRATRGALLAALPPRLARHVPALAAHGAFGDAEVAELAAFRREIESTLGALHQMPEPLRQRVAGGAAATLRSRLADATPEQLWVLRQEIDAPALRGAVDTLVTLAGGRPSQAGAAGLEAYRTALVHHYEELQAAAALAAVEQASLQRLALLRLALDAAAAGGAPGVDPLTLPVVIGELPEEAIAALLVDLNCVVGQGSITIPIINVTVDLPSINLNFICTPLENAINAVTSAVNVVGSAIDDVLSAIVGLPQTLGNALSGLFSSMAQGALAAFSPANLQNALGLGGSFWENLPQLPQIPCPPAGTEIPFFGSVGEETTAAKYDRYLWVFDKVLEIIPDTEVSLSIKIPAQVLYAGVQYLGVCLDAAAGETAALAQAQFRSEVASGLDAAASGIQSGVQQLAGGIGALGDSLALGLDDVRARQLRLGIEAALADGRDAASRTLGRTAVAGDPRVATFQLPAAFGGALEQVRDLVADVIAQTQAAGEDAHCGPLELGRGDDAFAVGEYKEAFAHYRRAYQESARTGTPGCVE